ncbi:GTP-binding protein [Paenibacillus sp. SZ31]|uniref:COR domain-containing protein n=1 Tax=Paenibacillus sp. SZ31 TaxID=2725555 RepID=UPI00146AB1F0|nr:COR domain-containing protein [Paenibacillus sp. SZ31]NMI06740.1 GTP-binding protein [Paenibacillus sp. SZ31]
MNVNDTSIENSTWESIIQKVKNPIDHFQPPIGMKLSTKNLITIFKQAAEEQWESINLTGAGINEIPKEIGEIKSLKSLSISSFGFFPDGLNNTLKVLPDEICELVNLESIDISGNPICSFPSRFDKLSGLKYIDLHSTAFDSFPEEILCFEHLEELNIGWCNIKGFPARLRKLEKLSAIYFHSTDIDEFPEVILDLTNLKELSISPKIKQLPPDISKLCNLTSLILTKSQITELPEQIGTLTKLERIYLTESKIQSFPKTIKNLINIKKLDIKGTIFEDIIPPEILNQPAFDVVNYIIRYQEDPNKLKLNESKMLIVGQGGVGKSSLLRRLIYNSFSMSEVIESTEGIDIEQWNFPIDGQDYKLNVWDFGGQEIYHSTHQFFLTNRSMYILVWDARQEDEYGRIDYWLNTVESFAGESPILLVINKCDERKNIKQVDLKSLQDKYPQIVDAYKVSCSSGIGIYDLEKTIKEESVKLPLTNIVWLSSWIKIRKHLEELSNSQDLITYAEYQKICYQYDVKESEAKSLSQYLHDLGIILHFQTDVLLKDYVILSPDWGTDAVYKVLDAEDDLLQDRNGMLYIDDLPEIWKNKNIYPEDRYSLILRLMENFQLSFEVERNKTFLIPELMENEEIQLKEIEFSDETCLTFQYEYEFLPAGVMTRFIVKAHNYLLNDSEGNRLCWKKGAYLNYNGSVGKIRLFDNVSNKRIEVHISGTNKRQNRELLLRIRSFFDEIHKSIKKLKLIEKIQCNCDVDCDHKFDYKMLLRYEEHGHEEAVCDKSMLRVSVSNLLDGIESFTNRQKERELFMDKTPHIILNNTINNENHNNNNSNSESKNINTNKNTTTITIEIKNVIDALQGDLLDMKEEVTAKEPELANEFDKLEKGITQLNSAMSKEEIIRSGGLKKFNRFMQEVQDEESLLGKTIKNIKYGTSIAQDIADKYNSIAEWCGLPVVPKLFLNKNKNGDSN